MPRGFLIALAIVCAGCTAEEPPPLVGSTTTSVSAVPPSTTSVPPAPSSTEVRAAAPKAHLAIKGEDFFDAESRFLWRGITSFRLVELTARAEPEAIAYLNWARDQKLAVVRVLTMATQLFQLSPDAGLKALPRLLSLAAERGLFVEVVALADSAGSTLDLAQHVKAVGAIAAAHPNALVEIANEPYHATQDVRLHDPAFVRSLVELIPPSVPVAAGSLEGREGYAEAGRYATWHAPRSGELDGWGHVLELAEGAALISRLQKPLISDEPMGAGEEHTSGRRDNDPRRFGAAAVVTRLTGLGATFHYEGGLQGRIPAGKELECLQAWSAGLDAVASMPAGGRFLASADVNSAAGVDGALAVFGRLYDSEVWVVLIDPGEVKIEWKAPWREASRVTVPGVVVVRAVSGV